MKQEQAVSIAKTKRTRNASGWDVVCGACSGLFKAVSHKQNVCSIDCRFDLYAKRLSESECWEWTGPKPRLGYGVLFLDQNKESGRRKVTSAHRYSYSRFNGEIPNGMCVMHTCDKPSCVNPAHLRVGTWAENNTDRSAKGRSGSREFTADELDYYREVFKGEGNPAAKLTEASVRLIKYDRSGRTSRQIAQEFGVSKSAIKGIKSGRTWNYV